MSIFHRVMEADFFKLHAKLQERYTFLDGESFVANGVMNSIQGSPRFLRPIFRLGTRRKFLFPDRGENISFQIINRLQTGPNGEEQIHWERKFNFDQTRYFNALMSYDVERNVIRDYLGEPPLIYVDLVFSATYEGFLQIKSENQRLVLGRIEIPIPKIFQGLATVTEKFDDKSGLFYIQVIVKNPLIGTLFSYEGTFTDDTAYNRFT